MIVSYKSYANVYENIFAFWVRVNDESVEDQTRNNNNNNQIVFMLASKNNHETRNIQQFRSHSDDSHQHKNKSKGDANERKYRVISF